MHKIIIFFIMTFVMPYIASAEQPTEQLIQGSHQTISLAETWIAAASVVLKNYIKHKINQDIDYQQLLVAARALEYIYCQHQHANVAPPYAIALYLFGAPNAAINILTKHQIIDLANLLSEQEKQKQATFADSCLK